MKRVKPMHKMGPGRPVSRKNKKSLPKLNKPGSLQGMKRTRPKSGSGGKYTLPVEGGRVPMQRSRPMKKLGNSNKVRGMAKRIIKPSHRAMRKGL